MYLLDTNVVSELRRPRPDRAVVGWLNDTAATELAISAVTLAEIQSGIEITRTRDAGKAAELERWAEMVAETYRVLAMDGSCFRLWAKLMHRQSDTLYEDAMIAATARVHGMTVVTRNIRDFEIFEVPVLNPFDHR